MRIRLSEERKQTIVRSLVELFAEEFDEELSPFRAERLLEHLVKELGAPVYNQAIRDARGYLLEKLEDLDGEFYEPEEPERPLG